MKAWFTAGNELDQRYAGIDNSLAVAQFKIGVLADIREP
jgi:hypothetical protein